jgi:protein-tyrosine kinase
MSIVERALARLRAGDRAAPPAAREAAPVEERAPSKRSGGKRSSAPVAPAPAPVPVTDQRWQAHGKLVVPVIDDASPAAVPWRLRGDSTFLNQLRVIKRNLLDATQAASAARPDTGKTLLVTSAVPGEGKTFTSLAIARSLAADSGRSLLLVDADMPQQATTSFFGLRGEPGLADVLAGRIALEDAARPTEIPGLFLLPAGTSISEGSELMAGTRFDALIERMREYGPSFMALFDTAPVLAAGETAYAAGLVDFIVTVVRADSTARGAVDEALRKFGDTVPRGVVLNGLQSTFIEDYYGYSDRYAYGKAD